MTASRIKCPAVLVALMVVALGACGGGSTSASVTTAASSAGGTTPSTATTSVTSTAVPTTVAATTTTTLAATTTTIREMTVQEVAAIVAMKAKDLREGATSLERCSLRFKTCSIVDQLESMTFVLGVYNVSADLQLAAKKATIPASLATLVKEMTGAAAEMKLYVGEDPTKTMSCGPGSSATPVEQDKCETNYLLVSSTARSVVRALNGWKVYGTE